MAAIIDFYRGKNILLTGATGFLGLYLVEKLLRSFPDVGNIYIIARSKKDESFEIRKKKFIDHQIFDRIKAENRNIKTQQELFSKLKWIEGELGLPNLGIQSNTLKQLQSVINIIIHSAAVINFDIPLKGYIVNNLQSAEDLLQFASGCDNFDCFLYVSTAYSQIRTSRHYCDETVLKHSTTPRELLKMAATLTADEMEAVAPVIASDWMTYYAFCKNAAENLCLEYENKFGIVIYRPGIVIHSVSEPAPYWIGNKLGFSRVLMEANRGFVLVCDPDVNGNSVPVDFTMNGALAAVWKTSLDKSFQVFNFTTNSNPISFAKAFAYYCISLPNYEHELMPKRYALMSKQNVISGSDEEKLIKSMSAYLKFFKLVKCYMQNNFTLVNDNIESLWAELTDDEKTLLPFNVKSLNWRKFYMDMNKHEFRTTRL